ncbi:16S rRNA (cytosine(1402)-N(4))-methyltransferase RsmH [Bdellovibrionota bacterium FG-2]
MTTKHVPILLKPIVEALCEPFLSLPENSTPHWIVDCTLGGGGHTNGFLEALASNPKLKHHKVLALDQDPAAIEKARERFAKELAEGHIRIERARMSEAAAVIDSSCGSNVLGLMADLGFSSDQLGDRDRGLSFQVDGPLDMRMDPSRHPSAAELLADISEKELERILTEYGEERFARRIAAIICERRLREGPPTTTAQLEEWIYRALPLFARKPQGRIHPATRTFQALRIAVNKEMDELDCLLENVILRVKLEGHVAILSFHSLEDRKVKHCFKESARLQPLTKKPIIADEEELEINPRARSAKLRIAQIGPTNGGTP